MESQPKGVILVGKKPVMNYVMAAVLALQSDGDLVLRARGRAISRAVDVSQIIINRFARDYEVKAVNIGAEERVGQDGRARAVSTIEIVLGRRAVARPTVAGQKGRVERRGFRL